MKRSAEEEEVCDSDGKQACTVAVDAQHVIRPSEVPEYLRESEFYKSLNIEDDEEFYVSANLMKANTNVDTLEDASDLLHTIRFWGLSNLPLTLLQFVLSQPYKNMEAGLRALERKFPFLGRWSLILDGAHPFEHRMEAAMKSGILEFVAHVESSECQHLYLQYPQQAVAASAAAGNLHCLQYALRDTSKRYSFTGSVFEGAVANGQLECVKFLYEKSGCPYFTRYGGCNSDYLPRIAVAHNQVECLKFLHDKGCGLLRCAEAAAKNGQLDMLKYVAERRTTTDNNFGVHVCAAAAKNGHLHCLEYLLEHNYPTHEKLCVLAVRAKSFACLQCAHSHRCPMSHDVGVFAASLGLLECLQYFFENGGEWCYEVCHIAALNGHLECLQYVYERGCPLMPTMINATVNKQYQCRMRMTHGPTYLVEHVAAQRHWDCVQYLIMHGCPLTRGLTTQLACKDQYGLLQLAVERGCEVTTEVGVRYAKVGNLESLQYALQHGCEASAQIPIAAARQGHLQCLIYAHQQGCVWSEEVCVAAARGGHLDCLQYAREHGCPWDDRVRAEAEGMGRDEVLKYVNDNNCPEYVEVKGHVQLR